MPYAAAIAAVAVALAWGVSQVASYPDLEWLSYDFTVDHVGVSPAAKDIVFVDVDEDTFAHVQEFPFPRAEIARLVTLIGNDGPKAFGLDVLLSEKRDAAADKAMAEALKGAGNVVVASEWPGGGLPLAMPLPAFCRPSGPGECDDSSPAFGYGTINLRQDGDGFIRQAYFGQGNVLSLPVALAQNAACRPDDAACPVVQKKNLPYVQFNGHKLPYWDREQGTFLIGSWGVNPVTTISAWQVLQGQVPRGTLQGKIVLLGQSNIAANDQQLTPLFRSYRKGAGVRMPGTAILGAAIRSLLEGTVVRPVPRSAMWTAAFLLCWAASFLLLRLHTAAGLLGALLVGVLGTGAIMLLYAKARIWMPFVSQDVALLLVLPLTLGVQFLSERLVAREANAERKQMMGLFASYVDPAVAETIWQRRGEVSLAGEERVATVMFTDIRSFTALSFGKPPAVVLKWLNEYLSAMDEVIREHDGFLNKFIGDGLMIIFGLPLSKGVCDDAQRAMRAAQAMLVRVEELNSEAKDDTDRPCLRIGIGVHSGPLMAGSIGSATRQEYSVIGETVNLASRLESQNKTFKTEILFSEATRTLLGSHFPGVVALGGAKVPGLDDPVPVYTLRTPAEAGAETGIETEEETTHEQVTSA